MHFAIIYCITFIGSGSHIFCEKESLLYNSKYCNKINFITNSILLFDQTLVAFVDVAFQHITQILQNLY